MIGFVIQIATLAGLHLDGEIVQQCADLARTQGLHYWYKIEDDSSDSQKSGAANGKFYLRGIEAEVRFVYDSCVLFQVQYCAPWCGMAVKVETCA